MISNLELYGRDDVRPINTEDADYRIALLKDNLRKLLKVHFMEQDVALIRAVQKAIEFWKKLKSGEGI